MESHFLMGNNDFLVREKAVAMEPTQISRRLKNQLTKSAIVTAVEFYCSFFGKSESNYDFEALTEKYHSDFEAARSLGLFQKGGVREKDHLNFWCLSHVFQPETYVESGVFIGSSMHAFIQEKSLKSVVAIDPDLSMLKISKSDIPSCRLIDDQDFSQVNLEDDGSRTLVYFDDHINTASRIIQASSKGLKYLLFDDSTGIQGVCQRLYPAIPTIPMIMNSGEYSIDDQMKWTFTRPLPTRNIGFIERVFARRPAPTHEFTNVSLKVSAEFLEQCNEAKSRVKRFTKIPDLGDYISQTLPNTLPDVSKFLVELNAETN